MAKTTTVTSASNGVTFTVRLVEKGDRHGVNFCLIHSDPRPTVEFYDLKSKAASYDFVGPREKAIAAGAPRLGQFVSSYYVHTLLETIDITGGLCLHGGVFRWQIDGNAVREAFQALGLWAPAKPQSEPPCVKRGEDPAAMPFYARTKDLELAGDIRDYFFRLLGSLHALQAAYPKIDVSHLIKSFEVHAGHRPATLEDEHL